MKISNIKPIKILDSRGEETIKVTIETDKAIASACIPQGKSTGKYEAVSLPADKAIENIKKRISPQLVEREINSQQELDQLLLKLDNSEDKSNLGANAILGVSLAFARAFSRSQNKKLYQYIGELLKKEPTEFNDMWLLFNIINGGAHSPTKRPQIQEYLILLKFKNGEGIWQATEIHHKLKEKLKIGVGDEGGFVVKEMDNEKPLEIISQTIQEANLGGKVRLGLDVAASQFDKDLDILSLIKKYNLLYVEDPLSEEEWKKFRDLKEKIKGDSLIVGDDLTVSNPKRIKKAVEENSIHGVIIKPNQIGTLSECLEAIKTAQENNLKVIISHRSGETCDPFIADLAVACGAWGFKAGAPYGGERVAKYNRLLAII